MVDNDLQLSNNLNHAQINPKYNKPIGQKLKYIRTNDHRWKSRRQLAKNLQTQIKPKYKTPCGKKFKHMRVSHE